MTFLNPPDLSTSLKLKIIIDILYLSTVVLRLAWSADDKTDTDGRASFIRMLNSNQNVFVMENDLYIHILCFP